MEFATITTLPWTHMIVSWTSVTLNTTVDRCRKHHIIKTTNESSRHSDLTRYTVQKELKCKENSEMMSITAVICDWGLLRACSTQVTVFGCK